MGPGRQWLRAADRWATPVSSPCPSPVWLLLAATQSRAPGEAPSSGLAVGACAGEARRGLGGRAALGPCLRWPRSARDLAAEAPARWPVAGAAVGRSRLGPARSGTKEAGCGGGSGAEVGGWERRSSGLCRISAGGRGGSGEIDGGGGVSGEQLARGRLARRSGE